ncbi:MAG TPA: hypothetical protein PLT04_04245 [Candidatus Saccharibacteria bacterium]|nr:hypothetical protein [Candidatus Saccharibacteria bacterium]
MTAQDYIQSKLDELSTSEPLQEVAPNNLEEVILSKVLSKKFRKNKADDTAIELCKKAIHFAVANNKPVKVGLLFGGNKLWRFDEAPEVDWAELFNLIYFARWMKTIASVYEHGAEFEYYSQDVSVERLNNIPRSETDQYSKTFRELIDWFSKYLPERVMFTYKRQAEEYEDISQYDTEIEEAKAKMLSENGGKLPEMSDVQRVATELNVRLRDGQGDDPEWREKVELEHQAIFATKTLTPYLMDETIIPTCPTPFEGLIATGSTKYSIAKFWAGVGVLEQAGEAYKDFIVTPKQLEELRFNWQGVDLGIKGKNFSKIRVANGR